MAKKSSVTFVRDSLLEQKRQRGFEQKVAKEAKVGDGWDLFGVAI